jgi:hypothetical protein
MEVTCQPDSHHQDLQHALFVDGSSWMFANKIPAYFYLLVYPNRVDGLDRAWHLLSESEHRLLEVLFCSIRWEE